MKLTGLIAATYTPFREDGSVNLDLIPAMIDYMIDSGVSGFYACGSTGEGESMSVEERKQVAQAFVSATKGRLPVVVQVGHNSVESACELARHAAEVGVDAISTLPPTYFKPASVDLLVDFIARVSLAPRPALLLLSHPPHERGFPRPSRIHAKGMRAGSPFQRDQVQRFLSGRPDNLSRIRRRVGSIASSVPTR